MSAKFSDIWQVKLFIKQIGVDGKNGKLNDSLASQNVFKNAIEKEINNQTLQNKNI